jgi:hypothetical protein
LNETNIYLCCLHYPKDYQGTLTEHKKEFFLFSAKDSFDLVARDLFPRIAAINEHRPKVSFIV